MKFCCQNAFPRGGRQSRFREGNDMAKRKKTNRKPGRAGKALLAVMGSLVLAVCALVGIGAINANTVIVRRAEVTLKDLPEDFDGKTFLYASDIDLCGLNNAGKAADLFNRLQSLHPDALLLGGDYTSPSLWEILNRNGKDAISDSRLKERAAFIRALAGFDAPLGKYAIRTPDDPDPDGLRAALTSAGFTPLFDEGAKLSSGGSVIRLVGLGGSTKVVGAAAGAMAQSDCVIALSPSPSLIPQIMINEAPGGGAWCDMILTGHTHGGQVRLLGVNALSLNDQDRNYLSGWKVENGIPVLTTSGVGCEGINVRLGSRAEVWLITLRRAGNASGIKNYL